MTRRFLAGASIAGGSLDGTTIGATTPAAGTFTSLSITSGPVPIAPSAYSGTGGVINKLNLYGGTSGLGISGNFDLVTNATAAFAFYNSTTLSARITSTGINSTAIGVTTPAAIVGTTVAVRTTLNLPSYTVATLPAAGTAGRTVFCSNARQMNSGGTVEAAGAGTGGLVSDNGSAWKLAGTNITAAA